MYAGMVVTCDTRKASYNLPKKLCPLSLSLGIRVKIRTVEDKHKPAFFLFSLYELKVQEEKNIMTLCITCQFLVVQ